jgi:hypothetical protein
MGFISTDYESLEMILSPPLMPEAAPPAAPCLAQMIEQVKARRPQTGSEVLKELRAIFPDVPLRLRVAALNFMLRQPRGEAGPVL